MDGEITAQPRKEWLNTAEYKSISINATRIEDRTVDGVAAVCGNVDDVGDVTHKGAFSKTIQEGLRRVKFLWNHDFTQPPTAKIDDLREIGRDDLPAEIKAKYPEATGGLFVRRTYLSTPRGDECLAGVRDGAITEMSYGYNPTQKDYSQREGKNIRNLRQVRLLDVSDVMWGANAATVAKKSNLELLLNAAIQENPELFNKQDGFSTGLITLLETKVGRMISAANADKIKSVISSIEQQLETLEDLLGVAEPPSQEAEESAVKALTDPAYLLALLELDLKIYGS